MNETIQRVRNLLSFWQTHTSDENNYWKIAVVDPSESHPSVAAEATLVVITDQSLQTQRYLEKISNGAFRGFEAIKGSEAHVEFPADADQFSPELAGERFQTNDWPRFGIHIERAQVCMETNGVPTFVCVKSGSMRYFIWVARGITDIEATVFNDRYLHQHIDQFAPALIALRSVMPRVVKSRGAAITLDDPILKKNYGFIRFPELIESAKRNDYKVSVAFIPWNHWRVKAEDADPFKDALDHFSICVHGCDHLNREFRGDDVDDLRSRASLGFLRMEQLQDSVGMPFDPVMIFPQGEFGTGAVQAVEQSLGFSGIANTAPLPDSLFRDGVTVRELLEPYIKSKSGMPVLRRRYPHQTAEIGLDLFLGRPLVICEHHEFFKSSSRALEPVVADIRRRAKDIQFFTVGELIQQISSWIPGELNGTQKRVNDLRHDLRVGVRRGLSEFRDNVLWKYPQLLNLAKQAARKLNVTSLPSNHPTSKETMIITNTDAVFGGFLESERKFPDRLALDVENVEYTYRELATFAKQIAATLQRAQSHDNQTFTGVLAYRTVDAFVGLLGALLAGSAYVPLNRTFPDERLRSTLQRSGCSAIIVDQHSEGRLDALIEDVDNPLTLIFTDREDCGDLREKWSRHTVVSRRELADAADWVEPTVEPDDLAYMLFTSGSTGTPKGVMVAHRNVRAFVDAMVERYGITEEDRFSQMFEMTFDPSVFDMFVAWEKGAAVCCPSQKTLMKPGKFIQEKRLTVWFSVPSTINFMKRFRMLEPGSYPTLRYAHFCGEPLPIESVKAFGEAAPNAIMENLYGPTEMTVTCMLYRWSSNITEDESENGIVPIGYPYPGMKLKVVDPDLREVEVGETGELIMSGPQVALGYYNDPERTAKAFVIPSGETDVYYRTGDRVRRAEVGRPVNHFGRIDQQIKVGGHRVELGEIEAVVRKETGAEGVVALGWPMRPNGADGIEVFVESESEPSAELHRRISKRLPEYMVPKRWHFRNNLPLNASGKYDRIKLTEELVAMSS